MRGRKWASLKSQQPCSLHATCLSSLSATARRWLENILSVAFPLSEFLEVGEGSFKSALDRAKQDNWSYFELDTSHKCMVTQPKELTEILLGIK